MKAEYQEHNTNAFQFMVFVTYNESQLPVMLFIFLFLSSLTIPKHQDNVDNAPSNAIWRKFEFIFIDHRLGVEIPWAFISGIFSFVLDDSYGGIKEILIVHLRFSSFIYTTSFCIDLSLSLMLKCFV